MARLGEVSNATGMVATLVAAGLVAGCTTTQQKAARLQLADERLRAAQLATRVRVAGSAVSVTGVELLREGRRAAFVIVVRNPGDAPVSELPISVGYRRPGGRRVYVNAETDAGYYDSHLPLIAGRASIRWVLSGVRGAPAAARPFVLVGGRPTVSVTGLAHPPALSVSVRGPVADGRATVMLRNASDITQYDLPLYATALANGRTIAAGSATVGQLNGGATRTVRIRLVGDAARGRLTVEALPTIYH